MKKSALLCIMLVAMLAFLSAGTYAEDSMQAIISDDEIVEDYYVDETDIQDLETSDEIILEEQEADYLPGQAEIIEDEDAIMLLSSDNAVSYDDGEDGDDDDGDDEDETENRDPEAVQMVLVVDIKDTPEANREPEYTAEVSRGNAVVAYEGWKCSDGRVNYSSVLAYGINDRRFNTFEEGKTYTYCMGIAAKGKDFFTNGTSFTVRGVSVHGTFNADMTLCMFDNLFTSAPVCFHEFQTVKVKATCTTKGREYRKCSLCGKEEQIRDIPALGHAYELDDEGCSEATCARAGMEMYRCTREDCGSVYVKNLLALGHIYVLNVLKTATDSREGTYNMVCANEDCEASTNKHTIFPYKSIKLPKSKYSYTGSSIKPSVTVTDTLGRAINPRYYEVVYLHNKNVGTATVHVTFSGMYSGKMTKTFKIVKGSQKISAKTSTITVAKTDVKKKAVKINLGAKAKTKLTYKVKSKKISVNSKGIVTVKKGTKKGIYTVTITAKGSKKWKKATKKIKIKVK